MKKLEYGIATILLTASLSVMAEPVKKDIIDYQQNQAHEGILAEKKANPKSESRPAVVSSHKKHSIQSPKAEMIKSQAIATDKSIEDLKLANPEVDGRPAVTTKHN